MRRAMRASGPEGSLLAVDAGNSSVCFGLFSGSVITGVFDMPAGDIAARGGGGVASMLKEMNFGKKADSCLISSVVPSARGGLLSICGRASENKPVFLSHEMDCGVRFRYDDVSSLGRDRIASAAACREMYPGEDVIIVDAGTAVTFGFLSRSGEFEGGLIMPGPGISAGCLAERAELLPSVKPAPFLPVLASSTEDAVRSGVFWGFVKAVDGIIAELKRVIGRDAVVVAAGGWSGMLREFSGAVDSVEPLLVLKGVNVIYRRNQK